MAELAYAHASGACGAILGGSNPLVPTIDQGVIFAQREDLKAGAKLPCRVETATSEAGSRVSSEARKPVTKSSRAHIFS